MKKNITIIGVPMDLGQSHRGVDMGPNAIRYAGVVQRLEQLNYRIQDLGNISVRQSNQENIDKSNNLNNVTQVVQVNERLAEIVSEQIKNDYFPLILGGDHSIAIGSLAGIAKHYNNLGVIWYDAHGDLNTNETSPSGNIHGMPLAASLGIGNEKLTTISGYIPKVKPENIIIIGARSLDDGEKQLIRKKGISVYTMHEIDRLGMSQVMEDSVNDLKERTAGVHLSLDLDGLDPTEAPGVGTPVMGGLTYRESRLAMEILADANMLVSAEFVEVNPILDVKNRTAKLAVGLIGSLFGEKLK
ncbi:MAG TPA: arginase [Bacillota bacterium]|nr:arginase [Bacillota bacterium]